MSGPRVAPLASRKAGKPNRCRHLHRKVRDIMTPCARRILTHAHFVTNSLEMNKECRRQGGAHFGSRGSPFSHRLEQERGMNSTNPHPAGKPWGGQAQPKPTKIHNGHESNSMMT